MPPQIELAQWGGQSQKRTVRHGHVCGAYWPRDFTRAATVMRLALLVYGNGKLPHLFVCVLPFASPSPIADMVT